MESEKSPSPRKTPVGNLLLCALISGTLAAFGVVPVRKHAPHNIWPVHSRYLLPLGAMLVAWVALGLAIVIAVVWALVPRR